ncbi:ArsA-related P-loop ATPase [Tsukamurella strandjordii]|uniref:ArsA-related P-loop ATPase n=1 Tax=Tsukamurella strandjordii TaxID=147577 RepID=A0AA90NIZ5_9ACTN|nr:MULTISPECIES: ArsA-related P-loop ATPase [Tsukamurella]MDP0399913.1 ArsA-related P-loop ATPase [Tsukamurella strandjordii]
MVSESTSWPGELREARLHFVSGKGGTGKSTVAAALALALASGGKKVLLVEVEGRGGIGPTFEVSDLPPTETKIATADGNGAVFALPMDVEATFLDYLKTNYGMGLAARALKSIGAIEFATTLAPGFKDILITGKIMECTQRRDRDGRYAYDAVVVDAPPTGRIGKFLDVTRAMKEIAKAGPIAGQADRVVRLLHSPDTVVHLVTLLESLPVQETAEAVRELRELDMKVGAVIVNRALPQLLSDTELSAAADGTVDGPAVRAALTGAGLELSDEDFAGLLTETIQYARTVRGQDDARAELDEVRTAGRLKLPLLTGGVDLGGVYELAEALTKAGVR